MAGTLLEWVRTRSASMKHQLVNQLYVCCLLHWLSSVLCFVWRKNYKISYKLQRRKSEMVFWQSVDRIVHTGEFFVLFPRKMLALVQLYAQTAWNGLITDAVVWREVCRWQGSHINADVLQHILRLTVLSLTLVSVRAVLNMGWLVANSCSNYLAECECVFAKSQ